MANTDGSSAIVNVLVSFYLVATDKSISKARTSAIHNEKFNVPLSGDEPNDLFNFVKHLKTCACLSCFLHFPRVLKYQSCFITM